MNKVILVGNLTRDPEISTTSGGISLCRFGIAVQRSFANSSGEREADFLNVVTWRGLADNCAKYLTKGNKVALSGSIQSRQYEDKNGEKKTSVEIVADDVEFLTPRVGGEGSNNAPPAKTAAKPKKTIDQLTPVEDDGLPF